jgi:hypothetical protein
MCCISVDADGRMNQRRPIPPQTYLYFFLLFAGFLFLIHVSCLTVPYFWDELGQFIPAALDLYRTGAWIPHSATPNSHPPAVTAWLAAFWQLAGYSVLATRAAMLLLSAAALLAAFLLAIRLAQNLRGAPAFTVILLLAISPLFYSQSMLALLDVPAMLFTALALLFFLQERTLASAIVCTVLVMVKETGVIVPAVLGACLVFEKRFREAALFFVPAVVLTGWILAVKHTTGQYLGNREFARYNLLYLLHPVRFPVALFRRLYFLFVEDFHWIGTLAILTAWRRTRIFRTRDWRIAAALAGAHVLAFSAFGGAMLERYLLPVLPIVYTAMVAGFSVLSPRWKFAGQLALILGLIASCFWNPPYPFPLENNLAFVDFVKLQKAAADFIEFNYPNRRVLTAWPMGSALSRPEFGYVTRALRVQQVSDFHASTLARADWSQVGVFVLYSRDWSPAWNLLHIDSIRRFCERYYDYEPDLAAPAFQTGLNLEQVGHWARHGQWIDVYAASENPREHDRLAKRDAVRLSGRPGP